MKISTERWELLKKAWRTTDVKLRSAGDDTTCTIESKPDTQGRVLFTLRWTGVGRPRVQVFFSHPEIHGFDITGQRLEAADVVRD